MARSNTGAPPRAPLLGIAISIVAGLLVGVAIIYHVDVATTISYGVLGTLGLGLFVGVVLKPVQSIGLFAVSYAPFMFLLRGQLLGVVGTVPITLSRALGGLLVASLLARLLFDLARGVDVRRLSGPARVYLLFSAFLLLSLSRAPQWAVAVPPAVRYLAGLLTLLAILFHASRQGHTQLLYRALLLGTSLASVVTIVMTFFGDYVFYQQSQGVERSIGALGGPNSSANMAVLGIALCLPLLSGVSPFGAWSRTIALGSLAAHGLTLALTLSRSGILGAFILLIFWGQLVNRRDVETRTKVIVIGVAVVALIAGILVVGSSGVEKRLSDVPGFGRELGDPGAGSGRIGIWQGYWRIFVSGSTGEILLGRGLGSSDVLSYEVDWNRKTRTFVGPHNEYLWLLVEQGVVGTAIYLVFLFVLGRWILRTARSVGEGETGMVLRTFVAYLATYQMTKEFFGWGITDMEIRWYFLVYLGTVLALAELSGAPRTDLRGMRD